MNLPDVDECTVGNADQCAKCAALEEANKHLADERDALKQRLRDSEDRAMGKVYD